jgi:hypothetical protein
MVDNEPPKPPMADRTALRTTTSLVMVKLPLVMDEALRERGGNLGTTLYAKSA